MLKNEFLLKTMNLFSLIILIYYLRILTLLHLLVPLAELGSPFHLFSMKSFRLVSPSLPSPSLLGQPASVLMKCSLVWPGCCWPASERKATRDCSEFGCFAKRHRQVRRSLVSGDQAHSLAVCLFRRHMARFRASQPPRSAT